MSKVIIRKVITEYEIQRDGQDRIYIVPSWGRAAKKVRELLETPELASLVRSVPVVEPVAVVIPVLGNAPIPVDQAFISSLTPAAVDHQPPEDLRGIVLDGIQPWQSELSQNLQAIKARRESEPQNNPIDHPKEQS